MGFQFSNTPSAKAPEGLEDGLVPAIFTGISQQSHPEWAKPDGKFGADDGERLHWTFILTDDEGEYLYNDGDPIEVDAANSTNFNTKSDKSKNALWLKAISPKAFALIDAGQPVDPATLLNSPCMLLIEIKDNGWPKVLNVLPAPKRRAAKPVAVANDEDEE